MTSLIGIVTVLFNSDDVLPGFFKSLAEQEGVVYKLYVIDNSKTDSGSRISRQLANRYGIDVEIVFNDANFGVAKGNNQGIELARHDGCDYILLSNNDIEFDNKNLFAGLVQELNDRQLDAVVPKIYYFGLDRKIWFAGGDFSKFRAITPHWGDGEDDRGQFDAISIVNYAPTCFVLMRANVFDAIGLMDEKYFVYFDDADFMWRMKSAAMRLGMAPSFNLWHKVSFSTGGQASDFTLYYGFRNRIYFIRKNFNNFWAAVSVAFVLATVVARCVVYKKKSQKIALLKGFRDGFFL